MLDLLRRELGRNGIASDDARWSVKDRAPIAVVQPESTEQVAAVLALCAQEGFALEPAGAGTWLNRGAPHDRDYIVLSTTRMDQVIEYEPEDLTIGVQAGMPLHKLQQIVGAKGQLVALDPPAHHDATIGAVASLASAGPLRCMYGTPRDQVLGLDAVTGDGRVLQVGGRVVKNVAGYDVTRLLVGSRGTLAAITRVNLKLRPLARHDVTWVIPAKDAASLLDLAAALYNAPFEPAAIELVRDAGSWKLLVRVHGNDEALSHARTVISSAVGLSHAGAANSAGAAQSAGAAKSAGAANSAGAVELVGAHAQAIWRDLLAREAAAPVYVRFSSLPARLPQLIAKTATVFPNALIAAHVYDGIVRVCIDDERDVVPRIDQLSELREQIISEGGTVLFPMLPSGMRQMLRDGPLGNEVRLMQGIKRSLDKAGVLP